MDQETTREVTTYAKELRKHLPEAKIYVFGSRAREENLLTSDYDLIVVSERFRGLSIPRRLEIVYAHWNGTYQADILPYTPEELQRQQNKITIAKKAMQEAVQI